MKNIELEFDIFISNLWRWQAKVNNELACHQNTNFDKQNKKKRGKDLLDQLHENPLKIKNFRPFKRENIRFI